MIWIIYSYGEWSPSLKSSQVDAETCPGLHNQFVGSSMPSKQPKVQLHWFGHIISRDTIQSYVRLYFTDDLNTSRIDYVVHDHDPDNNSCTVLLFTKHKRKLGSHDMILGYSKMYRFDWIVWVCNVRRCWVTSSIYYIYLDYINN